MRQIPILLPLLLMLPACGADPSKSTSSPAKAEPVAHESELLKLTLTPEAQARLGIATVLVSSGSVTQVRQASGEIVISPSVAGGVPMGSTSNLQQTGAQQTTADGEVARAAAQARLARIALTRAEALVREEAGSVRARDEAVAALATANATLQVARTQRRLLGPPVATMARQGAVWVRVSVFSGDVAALRSGAAITVHALGETGASRGALPVDAPPSANAAAGTVDMFYALANQDGAFRVGQRVAVDLPLGGQSEGLFVPSSAIVRDIHGGEWVYEKTAPNIYVRQRIEVASERDGRAMLARGLRPRAQVVAAGAAELFGTEFGAAH